METYSYDPKKVTVTVDGTVITGFAADSIVTVAKNEDAISTTIGCGGDAVVEENANESGTITLSLLHTSSSLAKLRSLATNRKSVSVAISDAGDDDPVNISASRCRITKVPDVSRGKTTATVSVTIFVPNLVIR